MTKVSVVKITSRDRNSIRENPFISMTKDRNLIASHEYDRIYHGREGMLRVTGDVNCDAGRNSITNLWRFCFVMKWLFPDFSQPNLLYLDSDFCVNGCSCFSSESERRLSCDDCGDVFRLGWTFNRIVLVLASVNAVENTQESIKISPKNQKPCYGHFVCPACVLAYVRVLLS